MNKAHAAMTPQGTFETGKAQARALDAACPLKSYREQFLIPSVQAKRAYFCGHSLGAQPLQAQHEIGALLEAWRALGVVGYFEGNTPWVNYAENLTQSLASLVGARPKEVVIMNSLTVNLHLMMASFYKPEKKKFKILIEEHAFPSDRFAIVSQLQHHGFDPQEGLILAKPREGESCLREDDLIDLIELHRHDLAMVLLPAIQYYTGQALDLRSIIKKAHAHDVIVGVDAAHAIGNIPLHFHAWGVDFAVWCHYKYLNAGPGAVGGCYIHQGHIRPDTPRFAGWWGHDPAHRMKMGEHFEPIMGAMGWQLSCPPVLSMAALKASLALFDQAGMLALREKSLQLTDYLAFLLKPLPVEIITPLQPEHHGAQLTLRIPQRGAEVFQGLLQAGFVVDWREPGAIRVAPVPFYNLYLEVYDFVDCLAHLLKA